MINSYNTSAVYISGLCFLRALCEGCVPQRPTSHSVLFWTMKDIPWYEGLYAVTEDGRVFTYPKKKKNRNSLSDWMSQYKAPVYNSVSLRKWGGIKRFYVHRLVALTFIPNPDNKPQVNHINSDKYDNRVENLEWVTNRENCQHCVRNGRKWKWVYSVNYLWKKSAYAHIKLASAQSWISRYRIIGCLKWRLKEVDWLVWFYEKGYQEAINQMK